MKQQRESTGVIHVEKLTLDAPELERVHKAVGIRPDLPRHKRWVELTESLAQRVSHLTRPRAIYRIDAVRELQMKQLELETGAVYNGAVGHFLAHSQFVATFVVTIGSALERLARRWMKSNQLMAGSIVDALASELVETAADKCQQLVRAWAHERGLEITPRYSPGYCGLNVRQQQQLFGTIPAERIGVRLTPSCLMLPIKSVSGLIGLGNREHMSPHDYPCLTCDHPNCMQRRAPMATGACFEWIRHVGGYPVPQKDA